MRRMGLWMALTAWPVAGAWAETPKATPEVLAAGKQTYQAYCAQCHGAQGDGRGPGAAFLTPKPRSFVSEKLKYGETPDAVFKTVSEGVKGTPMGPFRSLSEQDRWAVTHYVLSLKKGAAPTKGRSLAPSR